MGVYKKTKQCGWAITGDCGLYCGWWFTRQDAIAGHCGLNGKTWEKCRLDGDRCIKVYITDGWPKGKRP